MNEDGYVVDFGDVKSVMSRLCKDMNEHFICPTSSDVLQIESKDGQVAIRCQDGTSFSFPADDCIMLPLVHSSAEELAALLCHQLVGEFGLARLKQSSVVTVSVTVAEAMNQEATYTLYLADISADGMLPPRPVPASSASKVVGCLECRRRQREQATDEQSALGGATGAAAAAPAVAAAAATAAASPAPAAAPPSPATTPELAIPSMKAMMRDEMHVFALAAYGGTRELEELLASKTDAAERKALCNLVDPETGTTPLIVGIRRDNSSVALALIEGGADVHQANKAGWTPSTVATQFASPKVVQMLASWAPADEEGKRTKVR